MRRCFVLLAVSVPALAAAAWVSVAMAQKDDPADPLAGWKYPGATLLGSGGGGGGDFTVLVTKDDLDKVVAFYGKKVGEKLTPDRPGGMGIRGGENETTVSQDDSIQPGGKAELRPVVVRIFVRHAKDHDLTLVITHAKGEDQTHISLTYFKK